MNGVTGIINQLRARGLKKSLSFILMHLHIQASIVIGKRWDARHCVTTCGQIELDQVHVVGPNMTEGHAIVSTSPITFYYLSRYFPTSCRDMTFVDIGSRFGRALLMARRYGFRKIIGVDFALEACEFARKNIANCIGLGDRKIATEVLNLDAGQFDFPSSDMVI